MILEIGCGENPITQDTPDVETKNVDYRMDVVGFDCVDVCGITTRLPFCGGSLSGIVCQHVLEHHSHCSFGDNPTYGSLLKFLIEVHRVLVPGGFFESICPNFAFIAGLYTEQGRYNLESAITLMQWAMGGQRDKWDHHGVLLDFNILRHWAEMAGFERNNIDLLHPFDWFGLHVKIIK